MDPMADIDVIQGADYGIEDAEDNWYCEHRTFIGSPGGPDLLCPYCEAGISAKELRKARKEADRINAEKRLKLDAMLKLFAKSGYKSSQYFGLIMNAAYEITGIHYPGFKEALLKHVAYLKDRKNVQGN